MIINSPRNDTLGVVNRRAAKNKNIVGGNARIDNDKGTG
jgi:hypothetical protein